MPRRFEEILTRGLIIASLLVYRQLIQTMDKLSNERDAER